ncbi:hypothetical protein D917_06212, partial [Trichinella nativa]
MEQKSTEISSLWCTYGVAIKVRGYNAKNRKCIFYPNLPSAIGTVPQGPDVPIPSPPDSMDAVVL